MAGFGRRATDATFDLNLAPILDIIVSIVPMLLLSVVFVQVKMIETPVPQVVTDAAASQEDNKKIAISLRVQQDYSFVFQVKNSGKDREVRVAAKNGAYDWEGLQAAAGNLKESFPAVLNLDLNPEANVKFDDLVKTMDQVRKMPGARKIAVQDQASGQSVTTDLAFPNVTFANVIGEQ